MSTAADCTKSQFEINETQLNINAVQNELQLPKIKAVRCWLFKDCKIQRTWPLEETLEALLFWRKLPTQKYLQAKIWFNTVHPRTSLLKHGPYSFSKKPLRSTMKCKVTQQKSLYVRWKKSLYFLSSFGRNNGALLYTLYKQKD